MSIKIGQVFSWYGTGALNILSQVGVSRVALIGLNKNSNRVIDRIHVSDVYNITEEEFDKITGGHPDNFKQVSITITYDKVETRQVKVLL